MKRWCWILLLLVWKSSDAQRLDYLYLCSFQNSSDSLVQAFQAVSDLLVKLTVKEGSYHYADSLVPTFLFVSEVDASEVWMEKFIEACEEQLLTCWESGDEDMEVGEEQEYWSEAIQNPQNINELDETYLKRVLCLTDYQYYHLCRYVALHGDIMSYAELAAVDGFDADWVRQHSPFFKVGISAKPEKKRFSWKSLSQGKVTLLCRYEQILEPQAAYLGENPLYEGNPLHLLCKLGYQYKEILKIGWTAEKDAGESFFSQSNPQGFDYNAFYFSYKNNGWLQQWLVGDYQLQFGQGLAMGMGFQMQSSAPDAVEKSGCMKPHTSSNETQFLRGTALRIRLFPKGSLCLYYSRKSIDASLFVSDSDDYVERVQFTGYHRTRNELDRENALIQNLSGIYYSYAWPTFRLGMGGCYFELSSPLRQHLDLYNQFKFNGKQNVNLSMDYHWNHKKSVCFGEFAMSSNAAMACINGWVYHADDRLSLSVLHKYKSVKYHGIPDLLQSGMSLMNEHGFEFYLQFLIGRHGTVNATWKESRFPWLKYHVDAPSAASQLRIQFTSQISDRVQYKFVYRWKKKDLGNTQIYAVQGRLQYQPLDGWLWTSKADYQCDGWKSGNLQAVAFTQQLRYKHNKIQSVAFVSLFDVDDYTIALYLAEPELLYATSSACCIGRGVRSGCVVMWKPFRNWSFNVKYAVFRYADRQEIGSGATLIAGNHKSLLKMQMICKF